MRLSENVSVEQIEEGQAANTTAITSDAIDMEGFEGVMILGSFGTANAGNYAKVQQSDDSAGSPDGYSDLEGTKLVPSVSGNTYLIDVYRPTKRYLKVVQTRGASSTVGVMLAIKYGAKLSPTSHGTVIDSEAHSSPAEGTA